MGLPNATGVSREKLHHLVTRALYRIDDRRAPLLDLAQPASRPRELEAENAEANRYHDECRPGRHDHHDAHAEHRESHHADGDAPRPFISDKEGVPVGKHRRASKVLKGWIEMGCAGFYSNGGSNPRAGSTHSLLPMGRS